MRFLFVTAAAMALSLLACNGPNQSGSGAGPENTLVEMIGNYGLTEMQARMPKSKVQCNDGKLIPENGAPEAVARALESLRKARRWRGIVVHAGPEGIGIQRKSEGTNIWLYDLWLAEYLADKTDAA